MCETIKLGFMDSSMLITEKKVSILSKIRIKIKFNRQQGIYFGGQVHTVNI